MVWGGVGLLKRVSRVCGNVIAYFKYLLFLRIPRSFYDVAMARLNWLTTMIIILYLRSVCALKFVYVYVLLIMQLLCLCTLMSMHFYVYALLCLCTSMSMHFYVYALLCLCTFMSMHYTNTCVFMFCYS